MATRKSTAKKWTLIVLVIFILVAIIGGTYSRYTSTGSGTGEATVAKQAKKINTVDITSQDSFTITFNEVANANIVDNKIAPTSQLYADFVIDPTGSEVAVDFEFELGNITVKSGSTGSAPSNLAVTKVCYVESGVDGSTITADANGKYTGTIALTSQTAALTNAAAKTVRVYVTWADANTTAANAEDTTVGINAPTLEMTVTGTATQHVS